MRQSVDVVLALFGSIGDGSTQVQVLDFAINTRGLDQTSAARLLPTKITPAEIDSPTSIELRSFSPADIAELGFAATPAPTVKTGTTYTLTLADNNRLLDHANASAITVTVPANAAGAFPLGSPIEIAQTGAGQITVSGAGVTLRLPAGKTAKTRLQYSIIALTKRSADEWILSGDLA